MADPRRSTPPFVISYGGENFFLDRDLLKARQYPDRDITEFDGAEVSDYEVLSVLESNHIEGRKQVLIIDNANKIKDSKGLKAYIEGKAPSDDYIVLVAIVRSEKLPSLWQSVGKKGRIIEHKKLKTYDTNNEVLEWLPKEATRLGFTLSKEMAEAIYGYVGSDLYQLANELGKLAILVDGGAVTIEHLRLVLSKTVSSEPFKVAEAVAEKDTKRALTAVSLLYEHEGDEVAIPITYALMKSTEKLLLARSMLDRGAKDEDIAASVGMHPWRCKTFFIPQVRKHTFQSLRTAMKRLSKLDAHVKTSDKSRRTALELVVIALAT